MSILTVKFPGMRASVVTSAGITEEQAWQARENAAFERLASARECLDAVEGAIRSGDLPVTGGAR